MKTVNYLKNYKMNPMIILKIKINFMKKITVKGNINMLKKLITRSKSFLQKRHCLIKKKKK